MACVLATVGAGRTGVVTACISHMSQALRCASKYDNNSYIQDQGCKPFDSVGTCLAGGRGFLLC